MWQVAALPEYIGATRRVEQLGQLVGAKQTLAEATCEAYRLGRESACATLEARLEKPPENLHVKGTPGEFAPAALEEKVGALNGRVTSVKRARNGRVTGA